MGHGRLQQACHHSTAIQHSTRREATQNALTCGGEGRLCRPRNPVKTQRGDIAPAQQIGDPLSQCNGEGRWGMRGGVGLVERSFSANFGIDQVRRVHSMKTSSFTLSKSCLLPQDTDTGRKSLPHSHRPCGCSDM